MKVFVTGASGFIGSALVRDLLEAGHQVVGLARSDTSAAALITAGAEVHRGDLNDLDSLRSGAVAADGVIHLAFTNDFAHFAEAGAIDLRAVETIGATLKGTSKPFVVTSGTLALAMLRLGRIGTEADEMSDPMVPRSAATYAALALAERGVRSSIVRLAPCVHDTERQGLTSALIGLARAKGVSAFVNDGSNRWPAVHRLDAARLFRLALEAAPAGSRLHAVGEEGIPLREIAEAIGQHLGLPTVSISSEKAVDHFGDFAPFVTLDNPTSSALTQQWLGWHPQGSTLIADIEQSPRG